MKNALIEYGLTEKEAEIYLLCLKTGDATANRIAELANIPRSTTYDLLEKLKHNGLITTRIVKHKTLFTSSDPELLIKNLENKKQIVSEPVPKLKKLRNLIGEKPCVEVYEGKIALIKLLDEILDNSKLLLIGNAEEAASKIGYHPDKFRMKRKERKIPIKQILEPSKKAEKIKIDKYTKVKFLKKLKNNKESTFISETTTYHLLILDEITAIKVVSKEHANSQKIIFDELWKKAKTKIE